MVPFTDVCSERQRERIQHPPWQMQWKFPYLFQGPQTEMVENPLSGPYSWEREWRKQHSKKTSTVPKFPFSPKEQWELGKTKPGNTVSGQKKSMLPVRDAGIHVSHVVAWQASSLSFSASSSPVSTLVPHSASSAASKPLMLVLLSWVSVQMKDRLTDAQLELFWVSLSGIYALPIDLIVLWLNPANNVYNLCLLACSLWFFLYCSS